MPTINYQNRQAPTPFLVPSANEIDVLATAGALDDYHEGMSVNGGSTLHLEVDALLSANGIALKVYRRSDRHSKWAAYQSLVASAGKVSTWDVGGVGGFADVRVTAQAANDPSPITVSAKITYFPAYAPPSSTPSGGGNVNTVVRDFAFDTASPLVLATLSAGQSIDRALVFVSSAWDGAPSVQVGTVTSPDLLLAAADVNLRVVSQYDSQALQQISSPDLLILSITPSGATQGTGTVLVTIIG